MRYWPLLSLITLLCSCSAVDPVADKLAQRGEEVNNICFLRQVDQWTTQGDSAFVFRHQSDEYLVTLVGSCPALSQSGSPAYIVNRRVASSRCLSPEDSLRFGAADEQPSFCTVNRLFRWNDE